MHAILSASSEIPSFGLRCWENRANSLPDTGNGAFPKIVCAADLMLTMDHTYHAHYALSRLCCLVDHRLTGIITALPSMRMTFLSPHHVSRKVA
jgi:hypothetical protein